MIELTVPCRIESLNKTLRMHWAMRSRLKSDWMWMLKIAGRDVGLNKLLEKVPFKKVTIVSHRKRLLDKDNAYGASKIPLDAIKELGWIEDDSTEHIKLKVEQVKSKTDFTVIKLS